MTLTIFNGSPRYKKSNSQILTEQFLKGYHDQGNTEPLKICYLARASQLAEHLEAFRQAEEVIIIFPLYTDCMPGMVKEFLELLPAAGNKNPKKLGFIVQSGFPEAVHSVYVERYLEKYARRHHYHYLGTVIKGGAESIRSMPPSMNKKLFKQFRELGDHFARTGQFHHELMQQMRTPLKMNAVGRTVFRVISLLGLPDMYWNKMLKKHGAYHLRNSRPYAP